MEAEEISTWEIDEGANRLDYPNSFPSAHELVPWYNTESSERMAIRGMAQFAIIGRFFLVLWVSH